MERVEKLMNKHDIVEETIKILCSIELPMAFAGAIQSIQGSIQNLRIVDQMMTAEEKARQEGNNENADSK